MSELAALGATIDVPDPQAAQDAREHLGARTHGRLDELAAWLASVQSSVPAQPISRALIVLFGATPDSVRTDLSNIGVRCVESRSTDIAEAITAGATVADDEIERGTDLFIVLAPIATVAPAIAVSVFTNTEPTKVLGKAADISPELWMRRAVAVRDGRRVTFPLRDDPSAVLAAVGDPDLAAAAAFLLRATARRTPAVLDGVGAAAAAVVAQAVQPMATQWWQAADRCADPGHAIALTRMALRPLLDLGIASVDGVAGQLAVEVLRAAVTIARPTPA